MRIRRFIVDLVGCASSPSPESLFDGSEVILSGADLHHLKDVLRANPGEIVELCDRTHPIRALGEVLDLSCDRALLRLRNVTQDPAQNTVHLICGMVRPGLSDFIVEKSVELGVRSIRFFCAERSQGTPIHRAYEARYERLLRVATAALKQSGGGPLPEIETSPDLESALLAHGSEAQRLLFTPEGSPISARSFPDAALPYALLIGPEGGFTERDIATAHTHGYRAVSLGDRILRTETAVILACGLVHARICPG